MSSREYGYPSEGKIYMYKQQVEMAAVFTLCYVLHLRHINKCEKNHFRCNSKSATQHISLASCHRLFLSLSFRLFFSSSSSSSFCIYFQFTSVCVSAFPSSFLIATRTVKPTKCLNDTNVVYLHFPSCNYTHEWRP